MRARFFASDKSREGALATSFRRGLRRHGEKVDIHPLGPEPDLRGIDVAVMVGVKSRELYTACRAAGVTPIMFDKGYVRDRRPEGRVWEYWRVSIGDHHPTAKLMAEKLPSDRWDALGLHLWPWRDQGEAILLAGSSAKYHAFYGLEEPTRWASKIIGQIRERTDRPIIYRPKPSWRDAVPIKGTHFSPQLEKLRNIFPQTWAVVTHGSNISFEAAIAGVPSIVLGNGIGLPISATTLDRIEKPVHGKRKQWLNNVCYWQWTEAEMFDGRMWDFLKMRIG